MRRIILAALLAGSAYAAQAADMPDFSNMPLRGTLNTGVVNWQGYYVGGQAGYGSTDMNFTGSNSAMMARLLANTAIEDGMQVSQWPLFNGSTSQHQTSFGGFVGYNGQWDDVMLGVEANYMHGTFSGSSTATVSRISGTVLSDNNFHSVTASSTKSMSISDMGTLRGRAGYVVGNFMPYMFGGIALGMADVAGSVRVSDQWGLTQAAALAATPAILTASSVQHGQFIYGYSAGVGTEVNLFGNVFGRAEWEYVKFTSAVNTTINSVRAGIGYKF
jgi:opacity protein-like surface antigen